MNDLALVVHSTPPVAFYRGSRSTQADETYRVLVDFTGIRSVLRQETGESNSTASVTLDNGAGQLTSILANPPLYEKATIYRGGLSLWTGVITGVGMGPSVQVDLQGGEALPYTADLPIRTSGAWGAFEGLQALPLLYGRVITQPSASWIGSSVLFLADHAIAAVDRVTYQGAEYGNWSLTNTVDPTGRAVALLEVGDAGDPADYRVWARGKTDPDTGELLERPDQILRDILLLAGIDIPTGDLDELRAYSQDNGILLGGRVDSLETSIQSVIDPIAHGAGFAWGPDVAGLASAWPRAPQVNPYPTLTRRTISELSGAASGAALLTQLRVDYDYDWSLKEYQGALSINAPGARESYGDIEGMLTLAWVHSRREAQRIGEAYLAYFARPVWEIDLSVPPGDYAPGQDIGLDHPHCPLSTATITKILRLDATDNLTLTGPAGETPAVVTADL